MQQRRALEIDGGGGGDGAKVGLPVQGVGREWSGESSGVDGGALGSGDGYGGGSDDGGSDCGDGGGNRMASLLQAGGERP